MADRWAGISAGLLAGAAGATAMNAVSYLDQAVRGDSATTSAAGSSVSKTAQHTTDAAGSVGSATENKRAEALGPLGGLGIGLGVGAVAGLVRGSNATPPKAVAAIATGLVAMAVGEGAAVATGAARSDWASPANLLRDLVPHLAYGAVTGWALHRMVDPRTSVVSRFRR